MLLVCWLHTELRPWLAHWVVGGLVGTILVIFFLSATHLATNGIHKNVEWGTPHTLS